MLVVIGAVVMIGDLFWVVGHLRHESREATDSAPLPPSSSAKVLLASNVVFVLVLGLYVLEEGAAVSGGRGPDPTKSGPVEEEPIRDPAVHLPLAGMDGFEGDTEVACDRLLGFLFNMSEALVRQQRVPPMMRPDIHQLGEHSQCTMGEPDVHEALRQFSDAYRGAGLPPLAPFALLGEPLAAPEQLLATLEGTDPDATQARCEKLGQLLATMREELLARSRRPPLTEAQELVLQSGSCAARDPSVKVGLHLYRSAYERAGLAMNADLRSMTQGP